MYTTPAVAAATCAITLAANSTGTGPCAAGRSAGHGYGAAPPASQHIEATASHGVVAAAAAVRVSRAQR
jgi:hypothetical protein